MLIQEKSNVDTPHQMTHLFENIFHTWTRRTFRSYLRSLVDVWFPEILIRAYCTYTCNRNLCLLKWSIDHRADPAKHMTRLNWVLSLPFILSLSIHFRLIAISIRPIFNSFEFSKLLFRTSWFITKEIQTLNTWIINLLSMHTKWRWKHFFLLLIRFLYVYRNWSELYKHIYWIKNLRLCYEFSVTPIGPIYTDKDVLFSMLW